MPKLYIFKNPFEISIYVFVDFAFQKIRGLGYSQIKLANPAIFK